MDRKIFKYLKQKFMFCQSGVFLTKRKVDKKRLNFFKEQQFACFEILYLKNMIIYIHEGGRGQDMKEDKKVEIVKIQRIHVSNDRGEGLLL